MLKLFKNMFPNYLILMTLISLMICGCNFSSQAEPPRAPEFENRIALEAIDTLQGSRNVTVAKVTRDDDSLDKRALSSEEILKLQGYLFQDTGYDFEKTKKCLFIPEIKFHFEGDTDTDVFVSFICKQIKIVSPGKTTILDTDPMSESFHAFCSKLNN